MGNVNFMVSSDYFVKNFYSGDTNPSYLFIRSYSSFDSLFGVGVTWDTDYSTFKFWNLEFVSCFEFRASDLTWAGLFCKYQILNSKSETYLVWFLLISYSMDTNSKFPVPNSKYCSNDTIVSLGHMTIGLFISLKIIIDYTIQYSVYGLVTNKLKVV